MDLTQVIRGPAITEKTHKLISKKNEYTLVVDPKADKNLIKKAVKKMFAVDALKVRIINLPSKLKRAGNKRRLVKVAGFKKALVTLSQGQKIPLFEVEGKKK